MRAAATSCTAPWGTRSRPRPPSDLDLALALTSWNAYRTLAAAFPRIGDTGIRFRIADVNVDLLPFGEIEDPQGVVQPPSRRETLSVWAFEEIFAASLPLVLSPTLTVRIPTVAGYAAAKLGAWLDRSAWLETKDAADLALILYWYAESADANRRLYETPAGNEILIADKRRRSSRGRTSARYRHRDYDRRRSIGRAPRTLAGRQRSAGPRARTAWRSGLAARLPTAPQPRGRFDSRTCADAVLTPA